ncbi:B-cell receptor CD22-like isoform X2 [Engystomops pustulosus]|uniref:B-cell receptor CD22-like isoform X2 n=1 Tax=Engystomops pustulosus TaxID=76066 RepID=UPI003AFA165E
MSGVIQIFPLIIFQGFYLGSVCQRWMFPTRITALIGSCVEIPCTYPEGTSDASGTVWYLYRRTSYPEILNTEDSSSVMEEYRDRTSLVPGDNSCTLRIDPVRREDYGSYYPGITNNRVINAYDQEYKSVLLDVKDSRNFGSESPNGCINWTPSQSQSLLPLLSQDLQNRAIPCISSPPDSPGNINLNILGVMMEGEATTIRCAVSHTCGSRPPDLQWNKPGHVIKKKIFWMAWTEESELTYIPSYEDDGSLIQCTATHPNGQRTERSGTLNILYIPKNVTITITGKAEFLEGSDVTLQCNSVSRPDVSEYEWYKGETRLPDRGREMTVRSVTRDMEPYSCAARNTVGRGESTPIQIPVIYSPQNVTITVIGMDEVMEGSDVTLQCNSVSRPDVSEYEWYKGETRLPDRGREMTVRNVTRDMEPYSCAARNTVGRGESPPIQIPVTYLPKNVTITVIGMDEVTEGSDVMFQCNSVSRPDVSEYEWYKGETRLPDRGREMTVRNVTRDMEPYSCAARNSVGRGESAPIHIPVIYKDSSMRTLILSSVIGSLCLLLLVLLVCWRTRFQNSPVNETSGSPDATYTDLIKRNNEDHYEELKTTGSPDATYTDLIIRNNEDHYEELKPRSSKNVTIKEEM